MILLLDLSYEKDSLSKFEFVGPIANFLRRTGSDYEILHFSEIEASSLDQCDKIILSGTALKDDACIKQIDSFYWIKEADKCILGIGTGMLIISSVFGGEIISRPEIGLKEVDIVEETPLLGEPRQIEGYHLHNCGVKMPEGFQLVAGSLDKVDAFKHQERPIYGMLFHPEVRNRWILERFLLM